MAQVFQKVESKICMTIKNYKTGKEIIKLIDLKMMKIFVTVIKE